MTALAEPKLPTYRTAAAVLEGKTASGWKMVGWTAGRSLLIGLPMIAVGLPVKKVIVGSLIASTVITGLAIARVFNAGQQMMLAGPSGHGSRRRPRALRGR